MPTTPLANADPIKELARPRYQKMLDQLSKPATKYTSWPGSRLHRYPGQCIPEPPNFEYYFVVRRMVSHTAESAQATGLQFCKVCCPRGATR
jgi:hypothetical protein